MAQQQEEALNMRAITFLDTAEPVVPVPWYRERLYATARGVIVDKWGDTPDQGVPFDERLVAVTTSWHGFCPYGWGVGVRFALNESFTLLTDGPPNWRYLVFPAANLAWLAPHGETYQDLSFKTYDRGSEEEIAGVIEQLKPFDRVSAFLRWCSAYISPE